MLKPSSFIIPQRLRLTCAGKPEREAWLDRLPEIVRELSGRWALALEDPFDHRSGACSWVAPATCPDGVRVAFKVGLPHLEGEQEIAGLRFWAGDPTIRLLEADEAVNAMLLEWCEPGTPLRLRSLPEQDAVIAQLLRHMWRSPGADFGFRHLSIMVRFWCDETLRDSARWPDAGLVSDGIMAFEALCAPSDSDVLLATDLHASNVLQAERRPWLVIDPKPFVGDPAYDATQHLFNRRILWDPNPRNTIRDFASALGIDSERLRLWMFARAAAEPRDLWDEESLQLARTLST